MTIVHPDPPENALATHLRSRLLIATHELINSQSHQVAGQANQSVMHAPLHPALHRAPLIREKNHAIPLQSALPGYFAASVAANPAEFHHGTPPLRESTDAPH